jgi:hypothetical protein
LGGAVILGRGFHHEEHEDHEENDDSDPSLTVWGDSPLGERAPKENFDALCLNSRFLRGLRALRGVFQVFSVPKAKAATVIFGKGPRPGPFLTRTRAVILFIELHTT